MKKLVSLGVIALALSLPSGCSQAEGPQQNSVPANSVENPSRPDSSDNRSGSSVRQEAAQSPVIASSQGYQLTRAQLDSLIAYEERLAGFDFAQEDRREFEAAYLEEFQSDPAAVMSEIAASSNTQAPNAKPAPAYNSPVSPSSNLAAGHMQLRQSLRALAQQSGSPSAFPDQAFNTPSVNQLRTFMANSQVINNNYNDYSSSETIYTFCADGTFYYYYGSAGSLSSSGGDLNLSSINQAQARGHWDTYSEGGNDAVLLYSSDPGFADETMNNSGLLPMPIAVYQEDLIQLGQRGQAATPDMLLARSPITGCQ